MKRDISDLLDTYVDESVRLDHITPLSSTRIKELTMNRIEHKQSRKSRVRMRVIAIIAAVVCWFSLTAFAVSMFSSLSGDELSLSAVYVGNGIVSICVENESDKSLDFQPQLKLMRWSTSEEVTPISGNIIFSGTEFDAKTSGTMTIDISQSYDMDMLEQPLVDDHYYFVLTNNGFAFGQDWMCSIDFAEPIITPLTEPIPIAPAEADSELMVKIESALKPYFDYAGDFTQRRDQADEYLLTCQNLLAQVDGTVVAPASPRLLVDCLNPDVVFDASVPLETQHWLTGEHHHFLDAYGIPVGASDMDAALVISAYVPQHQGEIDGGTEIPLVYIFTYAVSEIKSPQDYAFIHGQLVTFEQLEQNKVYEDDQYVCYEVSSFFYTDLRQYVECLISQRSDIYFDEQIWERVEKIHNYYTDKDVLNDRFLYK